MKGKERKGKGPWRRLGRLYIIYSTPRSCSTLAEMQRNRCYRELRRFQMLTKIWTAALRLAANWTEFFQGSSLEVALEGCRAQYNAKYNVLGWRLGRRSRYYSGVLIVPVAKAPVAEHLSWRYRARRRDDGIRKRLLKAFEWAVWEPLESLWWAFARLLHRFEGQEMVDESRGITAD